jgi:pimeloyl-ACP methyl ester carboxylesterase
VIARIHRLTGLTGLLGAASLAVWLAQAHHWSWPLALLAGALMPLGVHASALAVGFTTAWAAQDTPPALRAGALAWWRAWASELGTSAHSFGLAQPWLAHRPLPTAAVPHPDRVPVLLIHGFLCNHAVWRPLARHLARRGHAVAAVTLTPAFGSIDEYSAPIACAVSALRTQAGGARIAVIGHSMGGLAARAWLRTAGRAADDSVAAVITLGTPHGGTLQARYARLPNVLQMRRNSAWLQALRADEPAERYRRFTVIRSWQDNVVMPQGAQSLPGARDIALTGIGHLGLACHPQVMEHVCDALDRAGSEERTAGLG